jgi:Fur family zinc uptake transcriptional regulator
MARARAAFDERGMRLTELRQTVFGEIAASHHAIGAYDIIDNLARRGTRLAPISVYRAIEALQEAGVVHRLESRNAFFACHANHRAEGRYLVVTCAHCGIVAEVAAGEAFAAIDACVIANGFVPSATLVEVTGSCAHCAKGDR